MRIVKITALVSALLFLLCACNVGQETISYADEGHTHVYGFWYDSAVPSCQQLGVRVRYCKICHAEQGLTIEIPEDKAKQAHTFEDIKVEPTEKDNGSFKRVCTLCGYQEQGTAHTIPALYVLLENEHTDRTQREGVNALLCSDTETHIISALVEKDAAIDATLARRLAVALPVVERLDTDLSADSEITVSAEVLGGAMPTTSGVYLGRTLSVRQLLGLWLMEGGDDTLLLLCALMGQSEAELLATVNARMDRLGATFSASSLRQSGTFAGVSVYDTAVLLAKSLDQPLICELLALNTNPYVTVNGTRPALYFKAGNARISAVARENGYEFLILQGEAIPGGIEDALLAP